MFVTLDSPTHFDPQRSQAAAFAAAQAIIADGHGINVPSLIMPPDRVSLTKGFYPLQFGCPDEEPLAVIIAGAAGVCFMQGAEALKKITVEETLSYLPKEYRNVVMSNRSAADAALASVKQTLEENERLFRELQNETYRYGSYLPKPDLLAAVEATE